MFKACPVVMFKAADSGPAGTFEAIVSVFGKADRIGDVVEYGAFAEDLAAKREAGDPVPVIFSHQWGDLQSHIGKADPNDLVELAPGDERLPDALKDYGGLYAKASLDVEEPQSYARRVWDLMKRRTLTQFSFAYDVVDSGQGEQDGQRVTFLRKLRLHEIGPTLLGMNPDTALLSAKAAAQIPVDDLLEWSAPAKTDDPIAMLVATVGTLSTDVRDLVAGLKAAGVLPNEPQQTGRAGVGSGGKSDTATVEEAVAALTAIDVAELTALA